MIRQPDLRKDWVWIKPCLEKVKAKTKEGWLVEDVYAAVSAGRAAMYVVDEPESVLVVYETTEGWTGEKLLHVWIVYSEDMIQYEQRAYTLLEQLRQKIGARSVVMESPRKGWAKHGWKVKRYIYER